jgi:hypothetical protein
MIADLCKLQFQLHLILFPAISTWAQIYLKRHWDKWRSYIKEPVKTSINGSIYEKWYSKSPHTVWSRSFQLFVNMAGSQNLYFNLPDNQVLAVSHRHTGLNTFRDKGPNGLLLYDPQILEKMVQLKTESYNYCMDREGDGELVYVNYEGLSHELQRNHYCFLRANRLTNIISTQDTHRLPHKKTMSGLDYFGDVRLWTPRLLSQTGRYYLGHRHECVLMECKFQMGKYPHNKAST